MGSLSDRVKLNMMVHGGNIPEFFKLNTLFFFEKYKTSDNFVEITKIENIRDGGFYFIEYKDNSNWMQFAPVFITSTPRKDPRLKLSNKIALRGVNFNFIPLQLRERIFDKFIKEIDFEKNSFLPVTNEGMEKELKKVALEYSIVLFDASLIVRVHRIHLEMLPRFLYSQHPKNKYDPNKLAQIWETKLKTREERDSEMMKASLSDFFDVRNEIDEKYKVLKNHIGRIRSNQIKYGKRK
jgi:hypothetical protein